MWRSGRGGRERRSAPVTAAVGPFVHGASAPWSHVTHIPTMNTFVSEGIASIAIVARLVLF